jgi:putative addiction module component (TIGR02574 family)
MAKKDDILAQAMTLPAKQRAALADDLWFSLNGTTQEEVHRAWGKEIKRRWAAFERGDDKAIPVEEVLSEARQRLRQRRRKRA